MDFDNLRLDRQLCFALYAATNAITRTYGPLLQRIGLTYSQYLVMLALWQHGAGSVRDVALHLRQEPDEIAPLIQQLAASGLVEFAPGPGQMEPGAMMAGEARQAVSLTEAGYRLQAAAAAVQDTVVCSVGMSKVGFDALRDDLNGLVDRLTDGHTLAINAVDADIGRRIAERRTSLGLSRSALADAAGVPMDLLDEYEGGARRVAAADLLNIVRALHSDISHLFPY